MGLFLYDLYQELKTKKILFCYSGPIAQASIEGVGNTLRRNLEFEEAGNTKTFAVFSVFIEQVQNVLNYSAEKLSPDTEEDHELRVGIIVIGRENGGAYYIFCGNRVYTSDVEHLRERLEQVRNLDKNELKTLYKERRRTGDGRGAKGAGLGLLEMARKAGKPIEYSFEPIDEDFFFFCIKVEVEE